MGVIRRLALACALALLVVGCDSYPAGPVLGPGGVVAQGSIDGLAWSVTAERQGSEVCLWTLAGNIRSGSCSPLAQGWTIAGVGTSADAGTPMVANGLVSLEVARVRVLATGPAGDPVVQTVTPVDLRPLGINARAFGLGLPEGSSVNAIEALGADGEVLLERRELGGPGRR